MEGVLSGLHVDRPPPRHDVRSGRRKTQSLDNEATFGAAKLTAAAAEEEEKK